MPSSANRDTASNGRVQPSPGPDVPSSEHTVEEPTGGASSGGTRAPGGSSHGFFVPHRQRAPQDLPPDGTSKPAGGDPVRSPREN